MASQRFLLDANVLLWWLHGSPRLGNAAPVIDHRREDVLVSAAALWELAIKQSIGRLSLPAGILDVLAAQQMEVLAVEAQHALAVSDLPMLHRDPFDRIQIAQAKLEGLTFVTGDAALKKYGVPTLVV